MNKFLFTKLLPLGALLCAVVPQVRSQVTFTFNAYASGTSALGYNDGQNYTFVFTTPADFTYADESTFTSSESSWVDTNPAAPTLFSEVSGDAFSQPSVPTAGDNQNFNLEAYSSGGMRIYLNNYVEQLGILTPWVEANLNEFFLTTGHFTDFVLGTSFVEPTSFFADYNGTYVPSWGNITMSADEGGALFFVTSVTISAVPEPSTWGVILGTAGLSIALLRRRQLRRRTAPAAA